MAQTVKIEGLRELETALMELDKHTQRKSVARKVLKKAAQPLADSMNRLAPEGKGSGGRLNESYTVSTALTKRQRKLAKKGKSDVEVYAGTNDPAGLQQEFGNVNHGPQPHVRPAWDSGKMKALESIKNDLGDEILSAAKRQAKRKAKAAK